MEQSGSKKRSLTCAPTFTSKDDVPSNDIVTDLLRTSGPADTVRVTVIPLAFAGGALVPVKVSVPPQDAVPPAPEIGVPPSSQLQDTAPTPLPLQTKVHDPKAWAEAGATANIESARIATAANPDTTRWARTPGNLLRVVVCLPEPLTSRRTRGSDQVDSAPKADVARGPFLSKRT